MKQGPSHMVKGTRIRGTDRGNGAPFCGSTRRKQQTVLLFLTGASADFFSTHTLTYPARWQRTARQNVGAGLNPSECYFSFDPSLYKPPLTSSALHRNCRPLS
jgi:hypothetical protein